MKQMPVFVRPSRGRPEKIALSRGFVKIIKRTMWELFKVCDMAEILCKRLSYLKFGKRNVGLTLKGLRDAQVRLPHLFSRCVRKFLSMHPCTERKRLWES